MEHLPEVIVALGLTGWIPVLVWWKNRIRLEEIRNQRSAATQEETAQALREIQRELHELRNTTTRFDLSFDAGISRLEDRVMHLEKKSAIHESANPVWSKPASHESPIIKVGHG